MVHLLTGLVFAYVAWRFIVPMPWGGTGKWLVAALLFLISQHYLFLRLRPGGLASPELPFGVHLLLGWLFGAFLLLAAFLLLKDVVALVFALLRYAGLDIGRSLMCPCWNYSLAALAVILSALGVTQAIRIPDVKTVEIVAPRLPAAFDGLRIVQISDLHASRLLTASWVEAVVTQVNALNPDLILITGDLVDGRVDKRAADVAPLAKLRARNGVYAILGNHEYYSNAGEWARAFGDLGLHLLINQHAVISRDGAQLVIAGVSDPAAARFDAAMPNLTAALSGADRKAFTVLMAHRPGDAAAHAAAGVDVQLSGHTHGGQIAGIHLLTRLANEGFVSGLYTVGSMQLYVSNGTGLWAGFPLRLGRPSEITEMTLRRGIQK
ncbi:metallophosphoesterase [Dentiradicibacter hellwigii]|uniref:Metallophosphoesterase n=1 Tax=Dentiradicibacter hellwigii TaxID=3149053 RepID=A0ABV4UEM1_9RHOO